MAIELEDGTIVRSLPEQVDYLTTHNEENEIAIDNLAARLEAAIAGVLHYKGSVATYADLPADAEIGDVYNVIDTGANYAWTGSEWDELGSSVDLSSLVDLTSAQTITGVKTFSNGIKTNSVAQTGSVLSLGRGGYDIEFKDPIYPESNLYDIGKSSKKWRDIWLDRAINLGASGIIKYENSTFTFNDDILPAVTESYDLGSSTYKYKDLYLSGTAYIPIIEDASAISFKINGIERFKLNGEDAITGRLYPSINNTFDIGTTSLKYKDLYLSGVAYIGEVRPTIAGNHIGIRGALRSAGSSWDIGSSTYPFKDIYLSGNLSDGTNTVNIADLKALIDYAKAQGWIS